MWLQRLISRDCCGGLVLTLSLLCISVGLLFITVSAMMLGFIFVAVGLLAEVVCLTMSRTRCVEGFRSR